VVELDLGRGADRELRPVEEIELAALAAPVRMSSF